MIMNLTKNQKLLIGILHFVPLFGIIAYMFYIFTFFIGNIESLQNQPSNQAPVEFFRGFFVAFIIIIITVIFSIALKVFDIIHLTKSNKNDKNNKVLIWVLLFVFAGTIAEIIYFFLEILPEKKLEIQES
jgi:membrane protease YdiL (CAAX protease family)